MDSDSGAAGVDYLPLSGLFTAVSSESEPLISVLSSWDADNRHWALSAVIVQSGRTSCFSSPVDELPPSSSIPSIVEAFDWAGVSIAVSSKMSKQPASEWGVVHINVDVAVGQDGGYLRVKAIKVEGQEAVDLAGTAMMLTHQKCSSAREAALEAEIVRLRAEVREAREKYRCMFTASASASSLSQPRGSILNNSDKVDPSSSTTVVGDGSSRGSTPSRKRARFNASESPTARKGRFTGSLVNPSRVFRAKPEDNDEFVDPDETT